MALPYSGKFSKINIFGNYNENHIWKLNFGILSIRVRVRVIITGKLLWRGFFRNKISESERDFGNFQKYLSPKISRYTVIRMCGTKLLPATVLTYPVH